MSRFFTFLVAALVALNSVNAFTGELPLIDFHTLSEFYSCTLYLTISLSLASLYVFQYHHGRLLLRLML